MTASSSACTPSSPRRAPRSSALLVVLLGACSGPSTVPPTSPTEQTQVESLVEPVVDAVPTTRELPVVETQLVEGQPWDEVLLNSPNRLVEPSAKGNLRFTAPRSDRLVVSTGGVSYLYDALGGRLAEVDAGLTFLNRRWAFGLKGLVLDLDSGKTFVHQVADRGEIEAAHDGRLSETTFAAGDQLWWTTLAAGGGRVWMGRVESERATRATPYDLADEIVPSVFAAWHAPSSRLLLATHGECGVTAVAGGNAECLHQGPYGEWHLRGDQLYMLKRASDVVVDLVAGGELPLQTPCPELTFVGAHEATESLFYTCADGGFGLHTTNNEFLHSNARHDEVDLMMTRALPWTRRFAMLGRAQKAGLIIDFDGQLLRVPGDVYTVGDRYAISLREGVILVTDLENRTTEPFGEAPCEDPKIAHLAADRFALGCVELGDAVVDGERQSLAQRARAAKVAYQRVLAPRDRSTIQVDGLIRVATTKALFVVTEDGAVDAHVFPSR